jgi:hypothetical protein
MAKAKAAPKSKKKAAPKIPLKENQKLIQIDMGKLRKKGWTYMKIKDKRYIVSSERREQWERDGKPSFDGFEAELKKAMK